MTNKSIRPFNICLEYQIVVDETWFIGFRLTRLINVFMYEISLRNEYELTTHDNIQYGNMRLIDN